MSQSPEPQTAHPLHDLVSRVVEGFRPVLDATANAIVRSLKAADRDLEHRMYEQASLDSARYALEHMVTARPVRGQKHPGQGRLDLLEYVLPFAKVPGFYAEFGVFKGETLAFVANRVDATVYGFDSFEGLPDDWFLGVVKGAFSLKGQLPQLAVPMNNYRLVKGLFGETLPTFLEQVDGPAAFLHIDCDLYESTRTVFDHLAPRIVPGTVIVFDEYLNYPGWQNHEFKAFQEFCEARRVTYRYLAFAPMMFSVAVIVDAIEV
ncbi:TylF/MycF/NovP-related O-methyltransferase [Phenylobacterium sp.]|uniref:TylF/MycF/NovP-related O-methyltransferase n=1 Tax=Phenylobacterium sp. TaxID=1871053 RepID=UPI00121454C1|nr:TylF/MycF/NovP-related O-methyltransferase [Phenylobacterium sp.]THD58282.1 MAG: class I SAM-dependent methyltransferase [Phenylobacterium sp.]